MTHSELVERAVLWLQGRGGCTFAFSEFHTGASWESPDAIGFRAWGSTVVECKTSRADFKHDAKKPFRRHPASGLGHERYFMVPTGLISADELPAKWGLLYAHGRHVKVIRKSEGFTDRNYRGEIGFLVSMLRRAEIRAIKIHYAAGNETRPSDFLNQWIKADAPVFKREISETPIDGSANMAYLLESSDAPQASPDAETPDRSRAL